jgi:hypothetical protein
VPAEGLVTGLAEGDQVSRIIPPAYSPGEDVVDREQIAIPGTAPLAAGEVPGERNPPRLAPLELALVSFQPGFPDPPDRELPEEPDKFISIPDGSFPRFPWGNRTLSEETRGAEEVIR